MHNHASALGPHHVFDFLAVDWWLSNLAFPSRRVPIVICQAWVNLLHIFSHFELPRRNEVYVFNSRFAFYINLLTTEKLLFLQIVVYPGDCIRTQSLEDSVVFQLFDNPLHLSSLLFPDDHREVKPWQTGQTSILIADDGCTTTLVILQGQIAEILARKQRVHSLKTLNHYDFLFIWVHQLVDLVM